MLRSKRIDDYQEARLADLKAGVLVPFDLHLYFSANRHILVWRKNGDVLSDRFLKKYMSRGMQSFWIHRDDVELWKDYLREQGLEEAAMEETVADETAEPPTAEPPIAVESNEPPPVFEMRTEEGRHINQLLESPDLSERHKVALTARAARQLISETVAPKNASPEEEKKAVEHARDAVRDILDGALESAAKDVRTLVNEVWEMSALEPEMDHAVNVASFAVLFALAFGRISPELLSDIALAALLHDIGVTQVPMNVVQLPWTQLEGQAAQLYHRHVPEGLRLLEEFAPNISPRVRPLIQQHHEKFDGTGFPHQLQGFQVNDIAQLVGMADTLVAISSGQWDGQTRPLLDTFDFLEKLEKSRAFPQHFNPEVFGAVMRWIRAPGSLSQQLKASEVVGASTRGLMKRTAS